MCTNPVKPSEFEALIPALTGNDCEAALAAYKEFCRLVKLWYAWAFDQNGLLTVDYATCICERLNTLSCAGGTGTSSTSSTSTSTTSTSTTTPTTTPPPTPDYNLINVQLRAGTPEQTGAAAIGGVGDYWLLAPGNAHDPIALIDADEQDTGATIELNQDTPLDYGGTGNTDPLMDGIGGNSIPPYNLSFLIQGLLPGTYDFYFYGYGANSDGFGDSDHACWFNLNVGGANQGTKITTSGSNPPPWVEDGQYVKFGSVAVADGDEVILTGVGDAGRLGKLSGMQISRIA